MHKMRLAAIALANGESYRQVAASGLIHQTTLVRWTKQPAFQEILAEEQAKVRASWSHRHKRLLDGLVQMALADLDPNTPPVDYCHAAAAYRLLAQRGARQDQLDDIDAQPDASPDLDEAIQSMGDFLEDATRSPDE